MLVSEVLVTFKFTSTSLGVSFSSFLPVITPYKLSLEFSVLSLIPCTLFLASLPFEINPFSPNVIFKVIPAKIINTIIVTISAISVIPLSSLNLFLNCSLEQLLNVFEFSFSKMLLSLSLSLYSVKGFRSYFFHNLSLLSLFSIIRWSNYIICCTEFSMVYWFVM